MESIEKILVGESRGVLSLTGGGGKTSLMFHLARGLMRSGKRVLTTTTTKIFVPAAGQSDTVLVNEDPHEIIRQVTALNSACRHVTAAASSIEGGKLKGFSPQTIRLFEQSALFDWIIVEADGSARRPLKAPGDHEPVVPDCTTVHVAMAGLEVLGSPLHENLVFRSALAATIMELNEGDIINGTAIAKLFCHHQGAFKGAVSGARRFIFLNKADDDERKEGAARIASRLRRRSDSVAEAVIVGQALGGVLVHAVHPLNDLP
jgi:probable selenium-dependent hydroxylase accessory protein YqeC